MSSEHTWAKRTKWLTQALIFSGTLNIALLATFAYTSLKNKESAYALAKPLTTQHRLLPTNNDLLFLYAKAPLPELFLKLEDKELVEEGLSKRDLALACLCKFHYFDLDRALGKAPAYAQEILLTHPTLNQAIGVPVFPGLSDTQFAAITHFGKTEKWPLTAQGLFANFKRSQDPSLLLALQLTPEYQSIHTLFTRGDIAFEREEILQLIKDSPWDLIHSLHQDQRTTLDLSTAKRREFLSRHLEMGSKLAGALLLKYDFQGTVKKLSDAHILRLLDLGLEKAPIVEHFAKEILLSPRAEVVWKKAASLLYEKSGEEISTPYDHLATLQRFHPDKVQGSPNLPPLEATLPVRAEIQYGKQERSSPDHPLAPKKRRHTVEAGDSLWKIARKYRVSVNEIMEINRMHSEKLRPGKTIEIPEPKTEESVR